MTDRNRRFNDKNTSTSPHSDKISTQDSYDNSNQSSSRGTNKFSVLKPEYYTTPEIQLEQLKKQQELKNRAENEVKGEIGNIINTNTIDNDLYFKIIFLNQEQ